MSEPIEVLTRHRLETYRRWCEDYHRAIQTCLTLAAGSLTLLVTFAKNLAADQASLRWLVPLSLGLLCVSLICGLLAMIAENSRHKRHWAGINKISAANAQQVDDAKQAGVERNLARESQLLENSLAFINDDPPRWLQWAGWGMVGALIGGIVAIGLFAIVNWKL